MRYLILTVGLALPVPAALPAMAASFTPPAGCETFLTVQSRQCRVSNHFKCAADAAGDQWRTDFDQEGPFFMSRINSEAEWLESFELGPQIVKQTLDANPADPASFSELLASGTDTFAFDLSREPGDHSKVVGFDTLTGREFTIDGETLLETEFDFTETDDQGTVLRQARGLEYVHSEWRLFFSGPTEWNGGDGQFLPMDGSPITFSGPGEPGFASTEPLFDCDPLITHGPAGAPALQLLEVRYGR